MDFREPNDAVTEVALLMLSVQVPFPEQAPDHPEKELPDPEVAVSVTDVPLEKDALQVCGQLIPAGLLVTVPVPFTTTVNWGAALKLAVTDACAVKVTLQEPVPEHAPDQPANVLPALGVAVSVTDVPGSKVAEQVLPQVMPAGLLVTVPPPEPESETDSATVL